MVFGDRASLHDSVEIDKPEDMCSGFIDDSVCTSTVFGVMLYLHGERRYCTTFSETRIG